MDPQYLEKLKIDSVGLISPWGVTVDETKNVYVTSANGTIGRVTKITPGQKVTSFAGGPLNINYLNPQLPNVALNSPNGVIFNPVQKNIYIIDAIKGILKVGLDGTGGCFLSCKQFFGHADGPLGTALFQSPAGGIFDKAGNLYIGDKHYIRKITPDGIVSTIAGTGEIGYKDGPGDQALLNTPAYFAFDSKGNLYASDNSGVRKIVLK